MHGQKRAACRQCRTTHLARVSLPVRMRVLLVWVALPTTTTAPENIISQPRKIYVLHFMMQRPSYIELNCSGYAAAFRLLLSLEICPFSFSLTRRVAYHVACRMSRRNCAGAVKRSGYFYGVIHNRRFRHCGDLRRLLPFIVSEIRGAFRTYSGKPGAHHVSGDECLHVPFKKHLCI